MQLKLTTFLLFISLSTSLFAATFRVNNTPGTTPDFDNLIDAHAIAQNGDTLLIEGGNDSYGELTMTKRLTLIGPGYFLDENPNNVVSNSARIRSITLEQTITDDPSSGAAGSELIGLDFGFSNLFRTVVINVDNVVIKKCRTNQIKILNDTQSLKPAIGIQILQNYIQNDIDAATNSTGPIVNVQILNNIIVSDLSLNTNSSGAILHNLLLREILVEGFVGEIKSNIALGMGNFNLPVLPNNQITHNISAASQFGDANENFTTLVNNLFVGSTGNSTDGQWQLQPNSPASGNAHDGTDRGPFGGSTPYVLSGQGSSPAIIFFEAEPVGTSSNQLKVRIRAKSSN